MIKDILVSIGFFTRIPVGKKIIGDKDTYERSIWYAPISGVILGLINIGIYFLFNIFFSNLLSVIFLVLAYVIVTGALHIDGLGDFFDGLLSQKKGEDFVKVMRDSKIGTGGIVAIVFYLLISIALLYELSSSSNFYYLIFMYPLFSRFLLILLPIFFSYPKGIEVGMAKGFMDGKINYLSIIWSFILIIFITINTLGINDLWLIFLALVIGLFIAFLISRKLRGITGDMIGAIVEISQIIFFIPCYFLFNIIYLY